MHFGVFGIGFQAVERPLLIASGAKLRVMSGFLGALNGAGGFRRVDSVAGFQLDFPDPEGSTWKPSVTGG
jgi:hypothetical protein